MLTWWKYWVHHFRKSRKKIPDDEKKITCIINQINYHEYEHKWCNGNDWKKEITTSVNMGT